MRAPFRRPAAAPAPTVRETVGRGLASGRITHGSEPEAFEHASATVAISTRTVASTPFPVAAGGHFGSRSSASAFFAGCTALGLPMSGAEPVSTDAESARRRLFPGPAPRSANRPRRDSGGLRRGPIPHRRDPVTAPFRRPAVAPAPTVRETVGPGIASGRVIHGSEPEAFEHGSAAVVGFSAGTDAFTPPLAAAGSGPGGRALAAAFSARSNRPGLPTSGAEPVSTDTEPDGRGVCRAPRHLPKAGLADTAYCFSATRPLAGATP